MRESPVFFQCCEYQSLIATQMQLLCQGQLKALTVENWWDIPRRGLLWVYPMPLPFFPEHLLGASVREELREKRGK